MANQKSKAPEKKIEEFRRYAKQNKEDVIVYIAAILGILFLIFYNPLGELILGVLAGYYFSSELATFIQNARQLLQEENRLRYIVLIAVLVGILLIAPVLVISCILVAAVKQLFFSSEKS